MNLRDRLVQLLGPLVGGRMSPSASPDGPNDYPLIVYQFIGGTVRWYVDNAIPETRHARVQIIVWARRQLQADQINKATALILSRSGLVVEPYGEPTDLYQEELKIYGARQDFGIWYFDPQSVPNSEP